MRKLVCKTFRLALESRYPGLKKDKRHWTFLRWLIFGKKDHRTGLPLIDMFHVAKAYDQVSLFRNSKSFISSKYLLKFRKDVMSQETFYWSDWNYNDERARVAFVIFPSEIQLLIDKEIYMTPTISIKDKVYMDTGLKMRENIRKVDREMMKQEALTYFEFAIPEARPLLQYMNNLSVHSFSKIIDTNFKDAVREVLTIDEPIKMRTQLEILVTLQEDLQPFYKPSEKGHTDRIFPCNYSIPMLRREVRKVLTKGWYEFDLCNSQLAIVAKLWDIPPVQEFLKSNSSIWPSLFAHYGFNQQHLKTINKPKHNTIKDVLKTSLYALIYGMSKKGLMFEINEGLKNYNLNKPGSHFFTHPLIKTIYEAREIKYKELNDVGEAQTIFGVTRKVQESKTAKGTPTKERLEYITSILAHQAQSVELYLLLPVVELASTTKDFYITLWQHDGFSVHFTDNSKVDYWIKKIQSAVQSKIDEQGILTHLEWELL